LLRVELVLLELLLVEVLVQNLRLSVLYRRWGAFAQFRRLFCLFGGCHCILLGVITLLQLLVSCLVSVRNFVLFVNLFWLTLPSFVFLMLGGDFAVTCGIDTGLDRLIADGDRALALPCFAGTVRCAADACLGIQTCRCHLLIHFLFVVTFFQVAVSGVIALHTQNCGLLDNLVDEHHEVVIISWNFYLRFLGNH